MAIRNIRVIEDEILRKNCREIKVVTPRIKILLDDMVETMYATNGVGLAGPQAGILKRLCVIDVEDGNIYRMINPTILETEGKCVDTEGCLSIPDVNEYVIRPEKVKAKYTDENGDDHIIDAEGLLARCICHELDHLDGVLFTDRSKEADPEEVKKLLKEQYGDDVADDYDSEDDFEFVDAEDEEEEN